MREKSENRDERKLWREESQELGGTEESQELCGTEREIWEEGWEKIMERWITSNYRVGIMYDGREIL